MWKTYWHLWQTYFPSPFAFSRLWQGLHKALPAFFTNPVSASPQPQIWHKKQSGCQLLFIALMTLPTMNSSEIIKILSVSSSLIDLNCEKIKHKADFYNYLELLMFYMRITLIVIKMLVWFIIIRIRTSVLYRFLVHAGIKIVWNVSKKH